MSKPVVIFDFDGTLADTVNILLRIYNDLAAEHGFRHVEHEDWLELRQGSFKDGFKWTGMSPFQAPGMLSKGLKMMESHTKDVTLFPEMVKIVNRFKKNGFDLYILSTNSDKVINEVIKNNGLDQEITVLQSSKIFGKSRSIRKLLKANNYDQDNVWMVGDEVRDMSAAKRTGINGIAVTWGLQPESILSKVKGIHLVHSAKEIVDIIEGK